MKASRARWILATVAGVCAAALAASWLLYRRIGAEAPLPAAMRVTALPRAESGTGPRGRVGSSPAKSPSAPLPGGADEGGGGVPGMEYELRPQPAPVIVPPPAPMAGAPLPEGAKPAAPSAAGIVAQLEHGLPAGGATRGIVPAQVPPPAPPIQLKRYPAIEAPNRVAPATTFSVMVSLDTTNLAPQTRIVQGAATAAGQLRLKLPANAARQWTIDVVLILPGALRIAGGGSNSAQLVLPERGDSTPAMFRLRAPAAAAARPEPIVATLWYKGAFLARIERDIRVGPGGAGAGAAAAAATPLAPVAVDLSAPAANLTLVVMKSAGGRHLQMVVSSPLTPPTEFDAPRPRGLGAWLRAQYALLAARSARSFGAGGAAPGAAQADAAFLDGFGRQLYRAYAPAPFKQAFWKMEDAYGRKFRTIAIETDDPTLPWELMRPSARGGGREMNFLGLDFDIARWDLSRHEESRPPLREALDTVDVLAPDYATALPGQQRELAALEKLGAHRVAPADLAALRRLLAAPPQGILHFAGHGGVATADGATQYGILLSGGVLDLMTLRGLEPLRAPAAHPLVFFNACEVGQSSSAPGFVDGWAPELVRDGASGYIGALWAVNDAIATQFSRRFYALLEQHLAGGADIGSILMQTRRDVYHATGNPTALAYVFYGDPYLTFYRPR